MERSNPLRTGRIGRILDHTGTSSHEPFGHPHPSSAPARRRRHVLSRRSGGARPRRRRGAGRRARRARYPAEGPHRAARGLRLLRADRGERLRDARAGAQQHSPRRAARSLSPRRGARACAAVGGRIRHAARPRAGRPGRRRRTCRTCRKSSSSGAAHAREHSLEVQLPFLQRVLGEFSIVPLAVGDAIGRRGRPKSSSGCGAAPRR